MDDPSVNVSKEVDDNQDEPVSPRFTFMIACLLFAILCALFIVAF